MKKDKQTKMSLEEMDALAEELSDKQKNSNRSDQQTQENHGLDYVVDQKGWQGSE